MRSRRGIGHLTRRIVVHPRNRPTAILTDASVREFFALLAVARLQAERDPAVTDPDATARAMVEAYYQGQLDRERIQRELAAA
jgi:hypothetical protein